MSGGASCDNHDSSVSLVVLAYPWEVRRKCQEKRNTKKEELNARYEIKENK